MADPQDPQQGQQAAVTFDSQPVGTQPQSNGAVTFDSQPVGQPGQPPVHNDELQWSDGSTLPGAMKNALKAPAMALEGIGEGVFSTIHGADKMVAKIPGIGQWLTTPVGQSTGLHTSDLVTNGAPKTNSQRAIDKMGQLAGNDNTSGSSTWVNKLGYGGESLSEFMMGDEALKGLSTADKLTQVAKTMKIIEASPRLMNALKLGSAAEKVTKLAMLTPEEANLVRSSPRLAKLIGMGLDAIRAGVTQGVQTTVRTGGDVGAGAKAGLATTATAGVLGAAGAGAKAVIGKGARAAKTVLGMGDVAAGAPTRAAVDNMLSDATHGAFSQETGTLQNNLDNATSAIQMSGEGAPQQAQITDAAKKFAKARKQTLSDNYQSGLDQLNEMSGDTTIPYEGSPLHQAATELVGQGASDAGPLDQALNVTRPGSDKLNKVLDNLTSVGEEPEPAEPDTWVDHNGTTHTIPPDTTPGIDGADAAPPEIKMQHLVEYRQKIARLLRNVPRNTENTLDDTEGYRKLLEGVDDTIGQLSDSVGEKGEDGATSGRAFFDKMNSDYKEGIQPFANKDVKNIMTGNLNNIGKAIMGGQTSVDDIAAVRKALGDQNFSTVANATLQNIVKSHVDDAGNLDYQKLFKTFNRIDPDVRSAMFGDQGKALSSALKVANDSSNGLDEIGTTVKDLLGGSKDKTAAILQDPERAQALARAVGPDGMKVLGNSILENQIREASTALNKKTGMFEPTHFDPDKVLDWWMSMKNHEEVRDAFFTIDKETSAKYNEMMADMANASSVKKLVKYGVLPVTLGTAGAVHSPGAALVAFLAGVGGDAVSTKFGKASEVLESMASSPRLWRSMAGVGNATDAVGSAASKVKAAATVTAPLTNAAGSTIYKGLAGALSDDQDQKDNK